MSSNLVQEMVQEMGPTNPALNMNPGMPMQQHASYNPMTQPQMQQQMPMGPSEQMFMQQPQMQQQMQQQPQMQHQQQYYIEDDDEQAMMDFEDYGMETRERSFTDKASDSGREALFLVIAFIVLSTPQVDQFLHKTFPQLSGNFYYLLAAKGVLLAIAYFAVKYFEII
jgi:hypothetical protein